MSNKNRLAETQILARKQHDCLGMLLNIVGNKPEWNKVILHCETVCKQYQELVP